LAQTPLAQMGCGASVSSRPHGPDILKADLRGLSSDQISVIDASDRTPKGVLEEISRLRLAETTELLSVSDGLSARNSPIEFGSEQQDAPTHSQRTLRSFAENPDFDAEGQKLLAAADRCAEAKQYEVEDYENLNMLWEHPETGARLYVGNERAAASSGSLLELGIGGIVRCLDDAGKARSDPGEPWEFLHFPIACWHKTGLGRTDKGVAQIVAPLVGFASDHLVGGRSILIHCLAGAHRAGTAGTICIMYLCQLDAHSAICAAKTARPCIELLAHLAALPRRFHRAQLASAVEPAVEAARMRGFQAAAAKVFAGAKR